MHDRNLTLSLYNCIILLILFVTLSEAAGFPGIPDIFETEYARQSNMLGLSGMRTDEGSDLQGAMIDNSIDEESYMIGMGDVFHLSVVETPSITYNARVNQNGDVRISEFGILPLGKISLREAKKRIGAFVQRKLGGRDSVYVTLRRGKIASVTVNGVVAKPGIRIVDGVLRVWDCIIKANNGVVPNAQEVDLRNVVLENIDTTRILDLFRYSIKNDLTQNPYIYPGDRIFLEPPRKQVLVLGEVVKPASGEFMPLRKGETVRDLFKALVTRPSADSSMVIVQSGATYAERYDTALSISDNGPDLLLEHGDVINVTKKSGFPELAKVDVVGAVQRPGPYSIVNQKTTAREIMEQCGGYLDNAKPERAYVLRHAKKIAGSESESPLDLKVGNTTPQSFGSIRQEMNFAFARMNNFKDYSVISLAEQGTATTLEDGDQLVVPYDDPFVYVSGSVARPGAYAYEKGRDSDYYIHKAGGFTNKSDRGNVYVVSPYHTSLQIKSKEAIEEGDIVVVPDSQNNKVMITIVMPFLQVASTLATIILAMVSVIQASK